MNEKNQIIADESAIEREYSQALEKKRQSTFRSRLEAVRNTWTAKLDQAPPAEGEFVGRVALSSANEDLDGRSDFYIGTDWFNGDDYMVFSWAAPVACTFYRKGRLHHEWCDDVVGVRVFAHRGGGMVDFEDAHEDGDGVNLFPKRQLQIRRAPGRQPKQESATDTGDDAPEMVRTVVVRKPEPEPEPAPGPEPAVRRATPASSQRRPAPGPPLQAEALLRRQLAAPKSSAMSKVLSTLQADQYEFIALPAKESTILQGHPGTGKTIIAAHRAAYMLNEWAPPEAKPEGGVLLVGPTEEYVAHVRGVLSELVDDHTRYSVQSLPSLLEERAGLPRSTVPTHSVSYLDVSPELARLIDIALSRARSEFDKGSLPGAADVYAELAFLLQNPPTDGLEPEWVQYLRSLPSSLEELKRQNLYRHRGFLAYIGARTTRPTGFGHIIVDEAQDIQPIEWEVLGLLGNRGGWTIVGDLNQRRTDHGFASWRAVAELLAIENDDGDPPVHVLERGYRSTAQIIQFANKLLAKEDRGLYSLQDDGEAPEVLRRSSEADLLVTVIERADALIDRVGAGSVAIITVDPLRLGKTLRQRGWRADSGDAFVWRNEKRVLNVYQPERARGLEFDAVVVVEPVDFPENVGRSGVLYTALTRANRFLTVVHQKPLPSQLKPRR